MGVDEDEVEETADTYILEPESPVDQEKVAGLLFTEGELETLP